MVTYYINELTPEQEAQLDVWADKWIDIALRPGPTDRQAFEAAVKECYRLADQPWHGNVVWIPSPFSTQEIPGGEDELSLSGSLHQRIVASYGEYREHMFDLAPSINYFTKEIITPQTHPPGKVSYEVKNQAESRIEGTTSNAIIDLLINPILQTVPLGSHAQIEFILLRFSENQWHNNLFGPMLASLSFYRDVCGLRFQEIDDADWHLDWERQLAMEAAIQEVPFWTPTKNYVIAYERPSVVHTEHANTRGQWDSAARRQLHADHGPALVWPDSSAIYAVHGVVIPYEQRHIVEQPDTITVAEIEAERNAEVRRIMIDRYGPARYVTDSGAQIVEVLPADHSITGLRSARLLRKDVPGDNEPIIYADLLNSTPEPDGSVKRYMLRVDPNAYGGEAARNVHAAAASTWRHADGSLVYADCRAYRPLAES